MDHPWNLSTRLLILCLALGTCFGISFSGLGEASAGFRECVVKGLEDPGLARIEEVYEAQLDRKVEGVFMQLEHEGSATRSKTESFFRYYELDGPVRAHLLERMKQEMGKMERAAFRIKTLQRRTAWDAFEHQRKLRYLKVLEEEVIREKGEDAVWEGDRKKEVCLLLKRKSGAPIYLADHPSFERETYLTDPRRKSEYGYFSLPEITTHEKRPALTLRETLERARKIIDETGHTGVHAHVFFEIPETRIPEVQEKLLDILSAINASRFMSAVAQTGKNLSISALQPWTERRSERIRHLLKEKSPNQARMTENDQDNEKLAFVGLRYWGTKQGKTLLSFELRGVQIPFKISHHRMGAEMSGETTRERDYSLFSREVATLGIFATALTSGAPIAVDALPRPLKVEPRLADANRMVAEHAPSSEPLPLEEIAKLLEQSGDPAAGKLRDGKGEPLPSLLMPFAYARSRGVDQAFKEFVLKYSQLARKVLAMRDAGTLSTYGRALRYEFDDLYSSWATQHVSHLQETIDLSMRKLARDQR